MALPFTPARAAYDRRLTLEVEVLDAAGRAVSARGRAVMGRGAFAVTVRPLRRVLAVGEAVGVEVTARDHAGRPVRAAVRVTLDQDAWNPIERRYTRSIRPLAEATVNTDSLGRGFVSLAPAPARSGRLEIRARAAGRARRGHHRHGGGLGVGRAGCRTTPTAIPRSRRSPTASATSRATPRASW